MIRIIAGTHRGRRLHTPPDSETVRPLPDRVRTSLFNMLRGHIEGRTFFDAFAGTGSFGLEGLSRGAERAILFERDKGVFQLLKRNVDELGLMDRAEIVHGDVLGMAALSRCPNGVRVVMFDPPYPMMEDPGKRRLVLGQFQRFIEKLDDEGFAIIRTPWPFLEPREEGQPLRRPVNLSLAGAVGPETHEYGSTALHWYARGGGEASGVGAAGMATDSSRG